MNRKLLAAAVAGALVPMAAQAVDISVSGQVNRMIRYADDGHDSDIQHLDNGASSSRWRMVGSGELENGLSAGATIEWQVQSNSSGKTVLNHNPADSGHDHDGDGPIPPHPAEDKQGDGDPDSIGMRHAYVWLSGEFGTLTLGHTGPAGNGTMWTSHSGAWAGTEYSSIEESSAIVMRTSGGGDATSLWGAFGSVSAGRDDILKYDTPAIGPASLTVSIGNDDDGDEYWGVEAAVSTEMGGSSFIGGAFVSEIPGTSDNMFGIAGGVAFANGTSVNLAYASRDDYGKDHDDFYANLSHTWGNSSVAIGYRFVDGRSEDLDDAQSLGVGFQQSLGSGVSVYAGFHNFSADSATAGESIEDVNVFHIGSQVTFN